MGVASDAHGFGFANDLHTFTQLLDVYELVAVTVVIVIVVVFFLRHLSSSFLSGKTLVSNS